LEILEAATRQFSSRNLELGAAVARGCQLFTAAKFLSLDRVHGLRRNLHRTHFVTIVRGILHLLPAKTHRYLGITDQSRQSLSIGFVYCFYESFLPKYGSKVLQ
jgi:hypothetical protein